MPDHGEQARTLHDQARSRALGVGDALSAHLDWKLRLRDAVARGYFELGADDAGRDDLCALGRWLNSLSPASGGDPSYDDVVELHARFHREAAVVVQYIEMGRIDEARSAMDPDSNFARASDGLVGLLETWREAA